MNYGFVTGLPRSGSAWLANYLSYGKSCFLHDPWKDMTPEKARSIFENSEYDAAGVVDSSNLFISDKLDKVFPEAKWVLVTRSQKDIEESCKTINFPLIDFTKRLKSLLLKKTVLKVPFIEMFDRADEIGRYLSPSWTCPAWRHEQLKSLNVQVHWGRVSDQFRVPETITDADVMTPLKMEYYRLVKELVNDDPNAIRFLKQLRDASELYRRLLEHRPVNIDLARETIEAMVTEWLTNPFIKNFAQSLAPAIATCIEKYHAKDMKHCPIDTDVLAVVAYIFKGNEGVKDVMPKVRELSDKILQGGVI